MDKLIQWIQNWWFRGRGGGGVLETRPLSVQVLSFSYIFRQKSCASDTPQVQNLSFSSVKKLQNNSFGQLALPPQENPGSVTEAVLPLNTLR